MLLLLALGVGGSALLLMSALASSGRTRLARRAARVAGRGRPAEAAALSLRRAGQSGTEAALHRLLGRPEALRGRLTRTGRAITLPGYLAVSAGIGVAGTLALVVADAPVGLALPAGLVLAVWLPHLAVGRLIARRVARFEALFPEAIGLMVRGLRSGLPATEAIAIVGREVADPVGEEFRRVADQVRLGQPLDGALWEAAKRVGLTEFSFLVVTMSVQRETGGNLAETLENLDQVLRGRRQLRLKIRAMTSEARASALIIGSLPFIMLVLLSVVNPSYVGVLFTTPTGHMMSAAGLVSLVFGYGVMARMARFEI
jgi:tight adherence protein B